MNWRTAIQFPTEADDLPSPLHPGQF